MKNLKNSLGSSKLKPEINPYLVNPHKIFRNNSERDIFMTWMDIIHLDANSSKILYNPESN
jgi:hypothetical protein